MTFIVLVYVDGEIHYRDTGAEYNISPKITFPAIESITLEDVKNEIYQGLGYVGSEMLFSLRARFDIGAPGPRYFQLIPVYEDRGWEMVLEKMKAQTASHVIELYVECTPRRINMSQS